MILYTDKKVSPEGKVNKEDLRVWGKNLLLFLAPLAVIYLLQLYGVLQAKELGLQDLYPTKTTQGALGLYVVNGLLDLLRKFTNGKE